MKIIKSRKIIIGLIILSTIVIIIIFTKKTDKEIVISNWKKDTTSQNLQITSPVDGTIFPPDIAPLTFNWISKTEDTLDYLIVMEVDNEIIYISEFTTDRKWRPDSTTWSEIKQQTIDKEAKVSIIGVHKNKPSGIIAGSEITISTSKDEVGAPIFFRSVPLPFIYALNNLFKISWRLGNISSSKPPLTVLENLPVCGNCHSFSKDGQKMGMDVDYANDKGSYVISPISEETILSLDKIFSWSDYKREEQEYTFGLLSQISPDGKHVVSTVKDRSVFVPVDDEEYSQLFFPVKGILVVYNTETKKFEALPGADDPEYVQSNPNWTPDGKEIIFVRSKKYDNPEMKNLKDIIVPTHLVRDFIDRKKSFKFDLYRIEFNNGKGGVAKPIPGASNNGMSNYFPRVSPDGKWIVFTQAKSFMLLQPDSKLFIMPSEGGKPREMNCNTNNMNSWHSWSPNGKWLVFSSKKNGIFTQLYLTHIDDEGNDSPPVLLENFMIPDRAANIPEFINIEPDFNLKLIENFMHSAKYSYSKGYVSYNQGDYETALKHFNKAIKISPKDRFSLNYRGNIYVSKGKFNEAIKDYTTTIELYPSFLIAYVNRAIAKIRLKDYQGALEDCNKVLELDSINQPALSTKKKIFKIMNQ